MKFSCAAKHLCGMPNHPVPRIRKVGSPKHSCLHCRDGVHKKCGEAWGGGVEGIAIDQLNEVIAVDDDATEPFAPASIWDDMFVTKVVVDGKLAWICGHCGKTYKPQHATRVIAHLLKLKGHHIAACKAAIPMADIFRYRQFRQRTAELHGRKEAAKRAGDAVVIQVEEKQASAIALMNGAKVSQ